jgi:hypothetical protein
MKTIELLDEFNFTSNINTITKGSIYHAKKQYGGHYTVFLDDSQWDFSEAELKRYFNKNEFVLCD